MEDTPRKFRHTEVAYKIFLNAALLTLSFELRKIRTGLLPAACPSGFPVSIINFSFTRSRELHFLVGIAAARRS
jgi:hypothetical protein